jgi:hypothetical protein
LKLNFIHIYSQETQNDDFDKLKRDRLINETAILKAKEKDLLDFIKRNEAVDPEKAVKLKSESKVGSIY